MNFQPFDRLPMIEWANWWDKTIARWHNDGLPPSITDRDDLYRHFGLDIHCHDWVATCRPAAPYHGGPLITGEKDYAALRQTIYPADPVDLLKWRRWAGRQQAGDALFWLTLDGFFWHPRNLFGIEPHLYAFYDQPKLMNQMNEDLLAYNLRILDQVGSVCTPDFISIAEDMSYNHGPMLSHDLFEQFLSPFYRRLVPELHRRGILVVVDSDGDISTAAAWFGDVGVDGLLPLERQAGVDIAALRQRYPHMRFIGHYDKMVMPHGEAAMRAEFQRLLPWAARGGFLPSVDHQTPPGVSYQQYQVYMKLFEEYAWQAGRMSQTLLGSPVKRETGM